MIRAVRTGRTYPLRNRTGWVTAGNPIIRHRGRGPGPVRPGQTGTMAVELDHTIVPARDAEAAARWFTEILGLPDPRPVGRFWQVTTANGVALDFATVAEGAEIRGIHYAFRISDEEFDAVYRKIVQGRLDHWAGPGRRGPGEINHRHGGRGVYFDSPDGHSLEVLTRGADDT